MGITSPKRAEVTLPRRPGGGGRSWFASVLSCRPAMSTAYLGARPIIEAVGLTRHPERGYYVETYRSSLRIPSPSHGGTRAASTAIYFLLTDEDQFTYLHRLRSDELFHLYDGGPLDV